MFQPSIKQHKMMVMGHTVYVLEIKHMHPYHHNFMVCHRIAEVHAQLENFPGCKYTKVDRMSFSAFLSKLRPASKRLELQEYITEYVLSMGRA